VGLQLFSQEWLDRQRELDQDGPEVPGASARIQHVVTLRRKEEVAWVTTVVDGRTTASELGRADDVDLTLLATREVALALLGGELHPDVAFMRGQLKLRGSMKALLTLLPRTNDPRVRAARATLAAETDLD
jgi:predicted lipid carrier protein YhbT